MLQNKKVIITGASFIGFHLAKKLIESRVASIKVVNLTNKHKKLITSISKDIEFTTGDLRDRRIAEKSIKDAEVVFHLAADHGGRGYVDLYQGNTATNFVLDGSVFSACLKRGVGKIIFASSGCVYPLYLQNNLNKKIALDEELVGPPYEADNVYGWAKLMGEFVLKTYYKDFGLQSAIGRLFTVYGEEAHESHAVIGSIAKAFIRQDPYEVWGDGKQVRNWTYAGDIARGLVLLAKKVHDASAVNLGTSESVTVDEMVSHVFKNTGFTPKKIKHIDMPVGPLHRVASNTLAKKLLGWEPKIAFSRGIKKTVDWYLRSKNISEIKTNIKELLLGTQFSV